MPTRRQPLAKSELKIVQVVWKLRGARVRDVVDALASADPEQKLDFWTVQTYLRRLKSKGYLRTRRQGRADVYLAAVRPDGVLREVIDDFVGRLFDGHALPLVQHLIDYHGLREEEIDELQAKLDALKKRSQS
jgi:BlaI family penicillinase repressor